MQGYLDLERYPLREPESDEGQALIARCRESLVEEGMFDLPGFLRPAGVRRCLSEIMPVMDDASFTHRRSHNIYFEPSVPEIPEDHPALQPLETANHTVCGDQLPGALICSIYDWPPLADFLAATLNKPRLHAMADPMARVNVMAYRSGEALNWHFDRAEFTVTLLLQAPQAGGVFQYRRDLRSIADPNYDGVARLLAGQDGKVCSLVQAPGTLSVFKGENTAHRVTPTEGTRPRVVAVLSYYERQGVQFSEEERLGFYGRRVPAAEVG